MLVCDQCHQEIHDLARVGNLWRATETLIKIKQGKMSRTYSSSVNGGANEDEVPPWD
jgi:hypothetical protein